MSYIVTVTETWIFDDDEINAEDPIGSMDKLIGSVDSDDYQFDYYQVGMQ